MKWKTGRRRRGTRRIFLLPQIVPMRPYVVGLMADLRAVRIRHLRLRRLTAVCSTANEAYEARRARHEAMAELEPLAREERGLSAEFRNLGVRIGDVLRGEMLFPCVIDSRQAFFVWFDDEPRPAHWRYRTDAELRPIPDHWFSLFPAEQKL